MSDPNRSNDRQFQHISFADGTRAFAIFLVILDHLSSTAKPLIRGHSHDFGTLGTWGVACFFVLSGYLLSRPYLKCVLDPSLAFPSMKLFYSRRFLRIVPTYEFALFAGILLTVLAGKSFPPFPNIIAYVFFLQNVSETTANTINTPLWTMPVDLEFYIVLPFVTYLMYRLASHLKKGHRLALLITVLSAIAIASVLYRYLQVVHNPTIVDNDVVSIRNGFGMADAFVFGIGLTLLRIIAPAHRPSAYIAAGCVALSVLLFVLSSHFVYDSAHDLRTRELRIAFTDASAAASAILIIYALSRSTFVNRFTAGAAVTAAASLAYAMYLLHQPVMNLVEYRLGSYQGSKAFFVLAMASVPLIAILAYLTHRFVETPFLTLKERQREIAVL